jgi:hypothetical protein
MFKVIEKLLRRYFTLSRVYRKLPNRTKDCPLWFFGQEAGEEFFFWPVPAIAWLRWKPELGLVAVSLPTELTPPSP